MLWDVHEELSVCLFVTFLEMSATVWIMAKETFSEYRKIRNLIMPCLKTPLQHKWKEKNSKKLVIYTLHLFKFSVSRLQQFGPNLFVI